MTTIFILTTYKLLTLNGVYLTFKVNNAYKKVIHILYTSFEHFLHMTLKKTAEGQQIYHEPVLANEVCEGLNLKNKKNIVDCTLGLGGHTRLILQNLGKKGRVFCFELDTDNLKLAKKALRSFGDKVVYIHSNFEHLAEELKKLRIKSVDGILIDLGLSSPQIDVGERGFSFLREGPLDMRFDRKQLLTAAEVINRYSANELTRIFQEYGEERFARKIALNIVKRRKGRSFKTTTELARFIEKLLKRKSHIHPATRIFQALRIEVNHELEALKNVLPQAVALLKSKGRLAVISYHSLEDRIVKQFFKQNARSFINETNKLTTTHLQPVLKIINKKPAGPSVEEIVKNPRSRSAKLRVAEKI